MKKSSLNSLSPAIIPSIISAVLATLLGFGSSSAKATDSQLFRVRGDAATIFTSVLPNGQMTWTSAVPNINYTLMALPGGQASWGAVVSGTQSGASQTVTVPNPAGPANVIAARTYFYTNVLSGITVNLLNGGFQQQAQAVSGTDGRCWFYDMPADSYSLSYNASAQYAPYYYGTYISANVGQSNSVNVYLAKNPTSVQPQYGTWVYSAPTFTWAGIPEAAYYQFILYRADPSQLTQIDSVVGLLQTNYLTTTNFVSGNHYYWSLIGYDIWAQPVLYSFYNFYAQFSGPGGGTNKAGGDQRVFGVLQCGDYPITNAMIFLTNTTIHVAYGTLTDSRGWFDIEAIPAGTYNLIQPDTTYIWQALGTVSMPANAGHQGVYYLIARAGNMQPAAHGTVNTHTPVFSWTGIAAAASYIVNVANWNTGQTIFNQNTGTATSLSSPVSLANGDYSWNVTGYDVDSNEVLYGWGGKLTVAGP